MFARPPYINAGQTGGGYTNQLPRYNGGMPGHPMPGGPQDSGFSLQPGQFPPRPPMGMPQLPPMGGGAVGHPMPGVPPMGGGNVGHPFPGVPPLGGPRLGGPLPPYNPNGPQTGGMSPGAPGGGYTNALPQYTGPLGWFGR